MRDVTLVIITSILIISVICYQESSSADSSIEVNSGESIQSAIDSVDDGGTVYVHTGTYTETITITKSISLVGDDKDTVIIDGQNSGIVVDAYGTDGNEISVNISGFTIKNAGGTGNDCIAFSYVDDGSISDNRIESSQLSDGVQLDHSSGNTISGNILQNNNENGINLISSTTNIIGSNNQILNNQRGIRLQYTSNSNTIISNDISGNTQYGIHIYQSSSNDIYLNDFSSNGQNGYDSQTNNWYKNSQGNYWDDYTGSDGGGGIGDTPYSIPGGSNQDLFPLGYFEGEEPETNNAPNAEAGGPYTGTVGQDLTFSGAGSTDPDAGDTLSYNWDFNGDGTYDSGWSSSPTTTYAYSNGGSYTLKLQVKDSKGATDVDTASVTIESVNQDPIATIIIPAGTTTYSYGDPIEFYGLGNPNGGSIIEYKWISSLDGALNSAQRFTRSNLSIGSHTISFSVQDNYGQWSNEHTVSIIVESSGPQSNEAPVAVISEEYSGSINTSIRFDGSGSYDTDGTIVSYTWDFGDDESGDGAIVHHTYTDADVYQVKLTVTDQWGLTNTKTVTASIVDPQTEVNGENGEEEDGNWIPGFEVFLVIISILSIIILKNKKEKK